MKIEAIHFIHDTTAISKKQFDAHMKLYEGYVDKTNQVTEELKKDPERSRANATYSKYRGLKKGETYSIDGVILHEAYFQNMTASSCHPGEKATDVFRRFFGSYEDWSADFTACGKAARGWSILVYEQRTRCFRNIAQDLHDEGAIVMAYPLLVMDMYEHACATCSAIEKITA